MRKSFIIPVSGIISIIIGISLLIFVTVSSAETGKGTENQTKTETIVNSVSNETQEVSTIIPDNYNEVSEFESKEAQSASVSQIREAALNEPESIEIPESSESSETIREQNNDTRSSVNETSEEIIETVLPEETSDTENESHDAEESSETENISLPEESTTVETVYFDGTTKVDTSVWNLILVNPDNYLPDNFTIDKAQVQGNYYLDSRVAPLAVQMIADAKKEGIELQICSSIRDIDLQTRLFNNKIDDLIDEGYSKEDARRVAATIVAVPGTSEHHTGLAMDIVTPSYQRLNSGYAKTDAAKWLKANAAKYGFILRYPEDKTEITKIIFEPWHYRYVGVEYASFIMSQGICFEEFIELYGETNQ